MTLFPPSQRSSAGRCWSRLRGDDRGAAMAVVAMLGTALVLIAAVIITRQMVEFEAGNSDRGWEEALHVAESGADSVLYELDKNHEYTEEAGLQIDPDTVLETRDQVVEEAEKLAADPAKIMTTPDGDVVVFEKADQADGKLYAVAFSPSIEADHRLVRVLETEYEVTWNAFHSFPPAALVSKGNVSITGNGRTVTVPSPPHEASVYSNGNVVGNGNAFVDGDVQAAGSVSGVGAAGSKTSGAEPVEFPEQEVVDMWRDALIADAQTGPTLGTVSSSRVIDAPAYIVGSIDLSGGAVVVNGPGTVFITGGIRMSGQSKLINNGAIIATDGRIVQSGQAAYEVQGDPGSSGMVTFSSAPDAIQLSGGSSGSAQGIVYAPNGGVNITGGAWFEGAILAGGSGGVTFSGNGTVRYPAGLLDNAEALPPAPDGVDLKDKNELIVGRRSET